MGEKPGLTLNEHRRLGLELAAIRDRLVEIGVLIANRHLNNSRVAHAAGRMTREIDAVRSLLDSEVFEEYEGAGLAKVYYPDPTDRIAFKPSYSDVVKRNAVSDSVRQGDGEPTRS